MCWRNPVRARVGLFAVEDDLEEDDEMRQWDEVSKDEEKTTVRRNEGRKNEVQSVREVMVSQAQMKKKEAKKEKGHNIVVGWSVERMEEDRSNREVKDSEEMLQWRSINQEEVDNLWKEMCK